MQVELIEITTPDGVKLHGIFMEPKGPKRGDLLADAVLMCHGSGGNFYASPSNPRAVALTEQGVAVALFNSRGHDVISARYGKNQGNAFFTMDDCRIDIATCVDWLVAQGYPRVVTWGSSLGGTTVVYAQAKNQHPNVAGVISLAPLRLSHEYFSKSELAADHLKFYEEAKAHVAAGNPGAVMEVTFPIPHHFSAATYLDRHCTEHYNLAADHTNTVACPLLILTGTEEKHPRMLNAGRDMFALCDGAANVRWVNVEGGDHGLHNNDKALFEEVMGWLAGNAAAEAVAR